MRPFREIFSQQVLTKWSTKIFHLKEHIINYILSIYIIPIWPILKEIAWYYFLTFLEKIHFIFKPNYVHFYLQVFGNHSRTPQKKALGFWSLYGKSAIFPYKRIYDSNEELLTRSSYKNNFFEKFWSCRTLSYFTIFSYLT